MVDFKIAKDILSAIRKSDATRAFNVKLEDVCRMQLTPGVTYGSSYNVFSLQYGEITILVRVNISETSGVRVAEVKTLCW